MNSNNFIFIAVSVAALLHYFVLTLIVTQNPINTLRFVTSNCYTHSSVRARVHLVAPICDSSCLTGNKHLSKLCVECSGLMTKQEDMGPPTLTLDEATPDVVAHRIRAVRELLPAKTLTDDDLTRFLVARQFHVEKTVDMVSAYEQWRAENNVDKIPMPGPQVPYLMSIRKLFTIPDVNYEIDHPNLKEEFKKFRPAQGGGGLHGVSKTGLPLMIERLGGYQVRRLAETCPPEVFKDFNIVTNEFVFNVVMREATERKGTPVGQVNGPASFPHTSLTYQLVAIFDCTGMGLSQFHIPVLRILGTYFIWTEYSQFGVDQQQGIMLLKVLAELNQNMYPERLGKLFVVNAPIFFTAAWAIIKVWLDRRILDKIHILGSDYKDVLLKHIDHDQLPSFLGGSCTCAHMDGGCVPKATATSVGDPEAYRYEASLKKHETIHEHQVTLSKPATIHYKFSSETDFKLEVQDEKEDWYVFH